MALVAVVGACIYLLTLVAMAEPAVNVPSWWIWEDPLLGCLSVVAVLWRRRDHGMAALPDHPVMRRWWDHMADCS